MQKRAMHNIHIKTPGLFSNKPAVLFLLPLIIYLIVWRVFPLFYTFTISFFDYNIFRQKIPVFAGFANYVELLTEDSRFHNAMKVNVLFTVAATLIEIVYGTFLALLLDNKIRRINVIRTIILIPMFLNPVAVGTIWYILYEPSIGPLTYFSEILGLGSINWLGNTRLAIWAIIATDIWHWSPFIFLLVLARLQSIPKEFYEAAKVDGASYLQILRHVTLPQIKSTIFVAGLLRSMDAFRIFAEIYVMTGGGPGTSTESGGMYVYKVAFKFYEVGKAAAITILMLMLVILIYTLYMRQLKDE